MSSVLSRAHRAWAGQARQALSGLSVQRCADAQASWCREMDAMSEGHKYWKQCPKCETPRPSPGTTLNEPSAAGELYNPYLGSIRLSINAVKYRGPKELACTCVSKRKVKIEGLWCKRTMMVADPDCKICKGTGTRPERMIIVCPGCGAWWTEEPADARRRSESAE